jgi:hypothetical protein
MHVRHFIFSQNSDNDVNMFILPKTKDIIRNAHLAKFGTWKQQFKFRK